PSLKGQTHFASGLRDALGREVFDDTTTSDADLEGSRITLTIDVNVQSAAEAELEKAVRERSAAGGYVVVMDPSNGDILALANYPTFDPNDPAKYPAANRNNQALTNPFEPGSTMKSILLASALQEKVVKPEDRFDCENGRWPLGSRVIHDVHGKGVLDLNDVIKYSSNICSAKIGLKLGRERWHAKLRDFGFGEITGITLPAETRGLLPNVSRWADISTATISFGQGISVSALQMVAALSTIANGGDWVRPNIMKRVTNQKGDLVKDFPPEIVRKVLDRQVARKATEILTSVTKPGGTGTQAAMEGFDVAGKTGTALKVDRLTRNYSPDKHLGLFIGFMPAENPRLVVLVVIDEPKGVQYGGVVAAPAFKAISTVALKNSGVFAKTDKPITAVRTPETGDEEEKAGDGYDENEPRIAATTEEVPNFLGLPLRRVIEMGSGAGIDLEVEGSGRAVSQDPAPGAKYRSGKRCRVTFSKG
ncbi:MAG: penicillin-binding protein, partial [Myxococcota bacterium]